MIIQACVILCSAAEPSINFRKVVGCRGPNIHEELYMKKLKCSAVFLQCFECGFVVVVVFFIWFQLEELFKNLRMDLGNGVAVVLI